MGSYISFVNTISKLKDIIKPPSETQIMIEILNVLSRIPKSAVLRFNNAAIWDVKRKCYRKQSKAFCPDGVSDVFYYYNSTSYSIEVKTLKEYIWIEKRYEKLRATLAKNKKEQHAKNQIEWIDRFNQTGNVGFFTYSLEHCLKHIGLKQ